MKRSINFGNEKNKRKCSPNVCESATNESNEITFSINKVRCLIESAVIATNGHLSVEDKKLVTDFILKMLRNANDTLAYIQMMGNGNDTSVFDEENYESPSTSVSIAQKSVHRKRIKNTTTVLKKSKQKNKNGMYF